MKKMIQRSRGLLGFVAIVGVTLVMPLGAQTAGGEEGEVSPSVSEEAEAAEPLVFLAPILGRPTGDSVTVNLVGGEVPARLEVALRKKDEEAWAPRELSSSESKLLPRRVRELLLGGLSEATEYSLKVTILGTGEAADRRQEFEGRFVTRRRAGEAFRFALVSDPHLPVPAPEWLAGRTEFARGFRRQYLSARSRNGGVFLAALEAIRAERPDFLICLGDMLDLHSLGFNPGFPSQSLADFAYRDFRLHLGQSTFEAPFFAVVGNWEGENGNLLPNQIRFAQTARRKYLPNPTPKTYPQGGGESEDYFAWDWGDGLFVVLNVQTYTTTNHTLGNSPDEGKPTDWTLGPEQMRWLERTLKGSSQPIKLIFIHHVVGGLGGDLENSSYGRGGGRAAKVGEQARVHELMLRHGVQALFYGHDHVFVDLVVDGIHYTLPGSAGAPWKFDEGETGYQDYDPRSGFGMVEVTAKRLRVEFFGLDGEAFRSYEVSRP